MEPQAAPSGASLRKVGIIIAAADSQTRQTAIRYATFHRMEKSDVSLFLAGPGAACPDSDGQSCRALIDAFTGAGGRLHVCPDTAALIKHMAERFVPAVTHDDIVRIAESGAFQSILTGNVYIRKFHKTA